MAESTSENVTASLRVMNADENWSVTSDQMAETLHDHMVGKTGMRDFNPVRLSNKS